MRKVTGNAPVSDNIARILNEKGLKQAAVAKKAGYSRQVFCNIVNDYRNILPQDIMRIASALEVEHIELLNKGKSKGA